MLGEIAVDETTVLFDVEMTPAPGEPVEVAAVQAKRDGAIARLLTVSGRRRS